MKKKIFLAFFFFASIITRSASALDSYEEKRVEKINIIFETPDPESKLDASKVLSRLKTQSGDIFSQLVFDSDLKLLSEEYDRIKTEIRPQDDKLLISLHLWIKPKIASINWQGNKIYKTSKLQNELGIKPGYIFSTEKFNTAINKVKDFYIKKGYFESDINYSTCAVNDNDIIININVTEGKSGKINRIELIGFTKKESNELLATLYTKKYHLLISWLTGQGIFRQDVLDQDQMTVVNYLNNKGYADAKVKINLKDSTSGNGINVEIVANKGTVYHIGKISICGNKLFTTKEIENKLVIHSNDIFSPEKIRESNQAIKDLYGVKGYIETQILQEAYLCESSPTYNVNFEIEEGQEYKIGLIRVFGNNQTNTNVILRESLLTPGKVFDSRRLKATQERLQNIGYFKNVNVYAVKSEADQKAENYQRDVYIEVEEVQTGSANISLGFSSLNDLFGTFELAERNFNIKGLTCLFKNGPSGLRGAGEYANAKVTIGRKQRSYFFTWMDPYFRDSHWAFGFDISKTLNELQSKDYKIITYGSSVFASHPLSTYWTFGTKYRLRHTSTDLKKPISKQDFRIEEDHGLISAVGTSLIYDSTDNPYKAHKGIRSAAEFEYVGVWGDFFFLKFSYVNSLYIPLWAKGTLKFRGDFRFIEPIFTTNVGKMPLSEKFFLGGETTVRGYKPYILGPRRITDIDDPIGGISSSLLSAEISHSLFKFMDLFVFFDAGSVSDKHFSIPKYNSSYGCGTRLEIMNRAPITIGYGVPINPDHPGDKRKFFFSMGGQF